LGLLGHLEKVEFSGLLVLFEIFGFLGLLESVGALVILKYPGTFKTLDRSHGSQRSYVLEALLYTLALGTSEALGTFIIFASLDFRP
jgi:hypothetical protein